MYKLGCPKTWFILGCLGHVVHAEGPKDKGLSFRAFVVFGSVRNPKRPNVDQALDLLHFP